MLNNSEKLDTLEKTSIIAIYILITLYGFLHFVFAFIFAYQRVPEMVVVNILSVVLCVINLFIVKDIKKLTMGLFLVVLNFCFYIVASTYILGYDKNTTILLPVLILLIHIIFPKKKKYLLGNTILVLIAYSLNLYIDFNVESKYSDRLEYIDLVNNFYAVFLAALIIYLKSTTDKVVEKYTNIQIDGLVEEVGALAEEASVDFLTSLWNRRYIEKKFETEDFTNAYIILADIDFFKKVNDTYGHSCGDYVLKEVSHLFKSTFRNIDDVCRWGGEEFLIYLKNADRMNVVAKLERIREKIEHTTYEYEGVKFNITITFGFCKIDKTLDIEQNINRADTALYYGKHNGRNCVLSYLDVKDKL